MLIRQAEARDRELIEAMLLAAADWRPGAEARPVAAVMADPALAHYAAWWRFFTSDDPGYGFVDGAVPEVSIGVALDVRANGIGRRLLNELVERARGHGLPGLSLSVEKDNFALRLYEQVGFERQGEPVGGSVTMLLALNRV